MARPQGTGRCHCLLSCHSVTSAEQNATATRYILIAIALLAVAAIVWTISDVLVIGFGAIVLATVLRVLVEPIARFTHWSERRALVAVVVILLGLFTLLFWLFGRQVTREFAEMREQLPGAVEQVRRWIAGSQVGRMALDLFKQSSEGANVMSNAGM